MTTDWRVEVWPIGRFRPYARNPRKNDHVVSQMEASIREFGFKIPMLARSDGEVVDGHLRLKAATNLALTELPTILCDEWTPAQVKAFRILVNKSVEWADWDTEALNLELGELKDLDFDLSLTGFDTGEIDGLLANSWTPPTRESQKPAAPPDAPAEGLTDDDAVPDIQPTPVTTLGDCWRLGPHRLLAGDATEVTALERLMGADVADLVFTDPPYNVGYHGYTDEKMTIANDKMSAEQFQQFLEATFSSYRRIVKPSASIYVCHSSCYQREFQGAMEKAGFDVRCQIIWAKNTFAWGFARYKFQHEPLFYGHVAGEKDPWYGDKSQSTLWQEKKPAANRIHPTAKPVELVERAIVNSSQTGDIVVDLFGGSGSTLIACERRGRQARLMELDPKYVDCIVRRWQEFTGKQATLEGDGRTFDQVKEQRVAA